MNIKKTICELWGKNWDWCSYYWDTVNICKETGLLANPECPATEERRVHRDDAPAATCAAHRPPDPPKPKWRICSATGREATRWCPATETVYEEPRLACRTHRPPDPKKEADFVLFSYDIWRPDYAEAEVEESLARIGAAGLGYVRTFLGWPGKGDIRLQPFLPAGAGPAPFDVYRFNPEWVRLLQRFQRGAAKCGVGIMMDFFGLQVAKMASVPYAWFVLPNNVNDINGYADLRPHVMVYWKWCLKKVMELIGVEGNLVHLGNEQHAPGDGGSEEASQALKIKAWAKAWALPLATYLRDEIKIELPLSFAGEPYHGTGHCIASVLSDAGWKWPEFCNHWHGVDLYENWAERFIVPQPGGKDWHMWAAPKHYALSDDGGGHNIPVEKRGVQNPSNPARWSASQKWRIDTVKRISGLVRHVRFVEFMPMEFKSDVCRPGDLDRDVSVDVYWRCAEDLWGIDIRRSLG